MTISIDLLKKHYERFLNDKVIFDNMYEYYKGNSDAMKNYKMVTEISNSKTPVNYVKKFIKEEVSYSVGNEVTYISKSGNKEVIRDIDYYMSHWKEGHNSEVSKNMLILTLAHFDRHDKLVLY